MSAALIAALVATVALLVITAYFLLGSVPLLVLRHDTPLDARFIRGFYSAYFSGATVSASATAVGYAFAAQTGYAAGAAALALLAFLLRRTVIPKMDALRALIAVTEPGAIAGFRRLHVTAILINTAQLVLIVWSLIALSIQLK